MEISLVICEVSICGLKSVVQRNGSDSVLLHSMLCFPACLDPRAGVDIVVMKKVRTSSEPFVRVKIHTVIFLGYDCMESGIMMGSNI
jgi:hypothetical protein